MVDEEKNSEGNVSLENVEKFDFKGKEVTVGTNPETGRLQVVTPEGLDEAETEEFNKSVPSLVASLHKKNFDANREKEALELKRRELELKERELALMSANIKPKEDKPITLFSLLGVSNGEEANEIMLSDPERYHNAIADLAQIRMEGKVQHSLQDLSVKNVITADGYSLSEVEAFQRAHGINNLDNAYKLFKLQNTKPTFTAAGVKRNVQDSAPEILPAGSANKKTPNTEEAWLKKLDEDYRRAK